MRFQCERCKTRYSIADEKVRGKVLKIRCKSCEAVITVRDGGVPPRLDAAPVTGGTMPGVSRPLDASFATASAGGVAPQIVAVRSPIEPSPPPAAARSRSRSAAEEWYLSLGGVQEGPFPPEQAYARVAGRPAGAEMFAWRDDFADWLPVEDVPALAVHLPKRSPPPPAPPRRDSSRIPSVTTPPVSAAPLPSRGPSRPSMDALFAVGAGSDDTIAGDAPFGAFEADSNPVPRASSGLDFDIAEPSKMVKLPIPASPGSSPRGLERPASLPGLTGSDMVEPVAGAPPPFESMGPAPRRRPNGLVFLVAALGTGVLAVVGALLYLRATETPTPSRPGDGRDHGLVDNFYAKDNPLLPRNPPPAPIVTATSDRPPAEVKPIAPVKMPPVRLPSQPRIEPAGPENRATAPTPRGKEDTFSETPSGPGEPLTPDDVRNTYAANEIILKRCYERSLKSDPQAAVTKMVVKLTISPQGGVSDIRVPGRSALATCVANSIRAWRFRRSSGEFTTEFTVFFAKR